jgi:hypothetical protein
VPGFASFHNSGIQASGGWLSAALHQHQLCTRIATTLYIATFHHFCISGSVDRLLVNIDSLCRHHALLKQTSSREHGFELAWELIVSMDAAEVDGDWFNMFVLH